jgi:hypothetical protein
MADEGFAGGTANRDGPRLFFLPSSEGGARKVGISEYVGGIITVSSTGKLWCQRMQLQELCGARLAEVRLAPLTAPRIDKMKVP